MATVTLVGLIVLGILANRGVSNAQSDEVCGNDTVDTGEQCDDGNLTSGDGCSRYCFTEVCGNGITDVGEQCDDGNQVGGDGCGSLCTIEFCGDQVTQSPETCDDGNNVSGDGCSALCQLEQANPLTGDILQTGETASSDAAATQNVDATDATQQHSAAPAAPVIPPRILQIAFDAATLNTFVRGAEGDTYMQYFSGPEQDQLKDILRALRDRRTLTPEQQEFAEKFAGDLGLAKFSERDRYNDMLSRLIATTISEGVISDQAIDQAKLTGDPTAIVEELQKVVTPLPVASLRSEAVTLISELQRQGIDVDGLSAAQIADMLNEDSPPIQVFEAIVTAKEKVEEMATTDVQASYGDILDDVRNLRTMLPVLETDYGVDRAKVEALLARLEVTVSSATPEEMRTEVRTVVDEITKLTVSIERDRKIDKKTLDSIDDQAAEHYLQLFADANQQEGNPLTAGLLSGHPAAVSTNPGDMLRIADETARLAPLLQRAAYASDDLEKQKKALTQYALLQQPDITRLRSLVQEEGDNEELNRREAALRESISFVGVIDDPMNPCDNDLLAAHECVREYTTWLESAARNRNILSRVGGLMEDLGVVDMFHNWFSSTPATPVSVSSSSSSSMVGYPHPLSSSWSSSPMISYPDDDVNSSWMSSVFMVDYPGSSSSSASSTPFVLYPAASSSSSYSSASSTPMIWYPVTPNIQSSFVSTASSRPFSH